MRESGENKKKRTAITTGCMSEKKLWINIQRAKKGNEKVCTQSRQVKEQINCKCAEGKLRKLCSPVSNTKTHQR